MIKVKMVPANTDLPLLLTSPIVFARRHSLPLTILLVGAVLDMATTLRNLDVYGPSIEVHPAQRFVDHLVGVHVGVPLAKLIQLAFVLLVASWWRPWCGTLLTLCGLLYGLAAASNFWLLF